MKLKLIKDILQKKYNLLGNNQTYDFFLGYIENKEKYIHIKKPTIYFVGLPEHGNLGDQAITVSMINFIQKHFPNYYLHTISFSKILSNLLRLMKHIKKEDIFVLIGGGNMGDVYFDEEEVRRIIIQNFPKNKIIIFPQTIDYKKNGQNSELKKSIEIYNKHKNLYLFAREKKSYKLMTQYYNNNYVGLVPDIVFSLDLKQILKNKTKTDTILVCIRKDKESAISPELYDALKREIDIYKKKIVYTDTVISDIPYIEKEYMRKKIVFRKIEEFMQAHLVITDRLHGMIFSALCNTPCIVVANYNHKVTSFYNTWLKNTNYIHLLSENENLHSIIENLWNMQNIKTVDLQNKFNDLIKVWRN